MKKRVGFCIIIVFLILPLAAALRECKNFYITEPNTEKALDITFLIDGTYTGSISQDYSELERQLTNLIHVMGEMPPFNEFINSKINIRYVRTDYENDLTCCKDIFTTPFFTPCDHVRTVELASVCPSDEILIFSANGNEEDWSCSAARGTAVGGHHAVAYAKPGGSEFDSTDDTSGLIIHELGHSLAFLGDEYLDPDRPSPVRFLDWMYVPNCEKNPILKEGTPPLCPKWRNVAGAGCYRGCTYEDWYRDSFNDIMRSSRSSAQPGPVDTLQFRSAINRYINYVQEPASIEIHKKTEEFIIQKFLENNNGWFSAQIPDTEFEVDVFASDEEEEEFQTVIMNLVASLLSFSVYTCHDYSIKGDNPNINLKFNHISLRHYPESNSIYVTFTIDLKMAADADLNAKGEIIRLDGTIRDCKNIADIDWQAVIENMQIVAKLKFSNGPLGIVKVEPEIVDIILPAKENINFDIVFQEKVTGLERLIDVVKPIFDVHHYIKSYDFISVLEENKYGLKDEFNKNMDEFGLSLKASLDGLGLEQLANMGKPHGMILDFYMKNLYHGLEPLTKGVEIDRDSLRLAGPMVFNTPLEKNKAQCVRDIPLNFNSIEYANFNRKILKPTNQDPFVSIKLSQTFTNWFIATLWNDGFFCAEKNIPISDNPDFVNNNVIRLLNVKYLVTPLNPPYVNYETLEDINQDGTIDINHDLVSKGNAKIDIIIEYELPESNSVTNENLEIDIRYLVPFVLEEKDISAPERVFTLSQSVFRTDTEDLLISLDGINCEESGILCQLIKNNNRYREIFIQEIKENIASHMNRAISEIQINPVRDVNLNFGTFTEGYFNLPLNLNYGEYVGRVNSRRIDEKWMTYDFDLVPKCQEGENCGNVANARIKSVEEVFYKVINYRVNIPYSNVYGSTYLCVKEPTEESKLCIDSLIAEEGELYHYVKIGYDSIRDFVSYNFNLINWNSYKAEPGRAYYVYLTDAPTYSRLRDDINIEDNADIHKFSLDATQFIGFRAKTEKGVEQPLECIASVIIDRSADMLDYRIQPVLATVEQRLRSDVNDLYTICSRDEHSDKYEQLILPLDIITT